MKLKLLVEQVMWLCSFCIKDLLSIFFEGVALETKRALSFIEEGNFLLY